jgi:hypothetical protein
VELWCLSLLFFKRVVLVFKTILFEYVYIFDILVIMYSLYYKYVWKLVLEHTSYEHSILSLKSGVTSTSQDSGMGNLARLAGVVDLPTVDMREWPASYTS